MPSPHPKLQPGTRGSTPSGLGGSFDITLIEQLENDLWRVRVNYPTDDWNGYEFTVPASKIRLEG